MIALVCLPQFQAQAQLQAGNDAVIAMTEYSNTYTEVEATLRFCFLKVRQIQKMINAESVDDRPGLQKRLDTITARVDVSWNSLRKNNTDFNVPGISLYDSGIVAEGNGDAALAVDLYTKAKNAFVKGKAGLVAILVKANSDLAALNDLACDPIFYQN